jgi:hypothetical protein
MNDTSLPLPQSTAPEELQPHLLYRPDASQAHFATWRLDSGQEALALFATADAATKYRNHLPEADAWQLFQPPRETLLEILATCLGIKIEFAVLNPSADGALTLFDLAQVVSAAITQ